MFRFKKILPLLLLLEMNCYGFQLPGYLRDAVALDTTVEKQLIYNGRLWRNLYIRVKGDPYFLTGEFLKANVIFNGKQFPDLRIKYDIHNDEVILYINPVTIITLNKEMTDGFTFSYNARNYHILNMGNDSTNLMKGFINVLYDGPTALFAKYVKKIEQQPYDRQNDIFYEQHRIYIKKDSVITEISGKRELIKILSSKKSEIKDYMRDKSVKITKKDPFSFIPVLQFYDGSSK